jgi:uncharacterized protein (TIGR03437 family)
MAGMSAAQSFTTLVSFNVNNGSLPVGQLLQGADGNFYGTTSSGGANGAGTVFKMAQDGTLTTLHSFSYTDGAGPYAGLIQAADGNLYGTTSGGGPSSAGTIFKITTVGTLTVLHSFNVTDGQNPKAALIQTSNGNLYGTTSNTVFEVTAGGTFTTIVSGFPDGTDFQGLIQGSDGKFYGTSRTGGGHGEGSVFSLTPGGTLTTLHSFNITDGSFPICSLVQAADGNFYGTTSLGGDSSVGTVFRMSSDGTFTTLHSFSLAEGGEPYAGLIQATDGNFYGTALYGASVGGATSRGAVFKMASGGVLTILHSFNNADGISPMAGVIEGKDGNLYGTTNNAGPNQWGTVFELQTALPLPAPVIMLVQNAEGGGATIAPNTWVTLKGTNLAPAGDSRIWGTSDFVGGQMPVKLDGVSVSMNGESAYVYYISPTQINVLTPPDLVTGSVQVQVTTSIGTSAAFSAQAQSESPSFFIFGTGPYLAATHADGSLVGPATLYPGQSTPVAPGESIVVYANGFGPTSLSVVKGSSMQSGSLNPLPNVMIGGAPATVQFAGLISPGLYQFNIVVPASAPAGDNAITATYNGFSTQAGAFLTVHP